MIQTLAAKKKKDERLPS